MILKSYMKETKNITIQIAGQRTFNLDISPENIERMRQVEREVNGLWAKWCGDFPDKSPQDILAMVTFQYARHYYGLLDKVNDSEEMVTEFEKMLDAILLDIK